MTTAAAGLLAALVVALAAARIRPVPVSRPIPATAGHHAPPQAPASQRLGPRLPRAGAAVLALVGALVAPPLALVVPAGAWLWRRRTELRARAAHGRAVARSLPDAVDLLLLCTSAGLSFPVAHPLAAPIVPPPVGDALAAAAALADAGQPRADALLSALAPLGPGARRLGDVLADHLRYGVPLAPGLERLGAELRLDRRRRAEHEARQVPVRLLGPLVTCVLPAFALLTVVPLLAASLRGLPT